MSKRQLQSARRRGQVSFVSSKTASAVTRAMVHFPQWAMNLFKPYRYKVVYGGRGAARSWSFARAILLICARAKTRVLCTREIQSSLKDSVHQLMRDQIDLLQLPGFIITDREIRHTNGSLILFAGLRNNVTKIKSIEAIDICWVEEAERVSKESWRVLIPTIRKANAEIWVSFNPDQEEDATWQRLVAKKPPRSWVIKVNADQNPWFPQSLREERDYDYSVDPEAADHIWGGNLRTASDAQILRNKWIVEDFVVPMVHEREGDESSALVPLWDGPYQGMDFGFAADPFAAIKCWIWDDTLYVEYEAYGLGVEIDHATDFVASAIPGFSNHRTRADSARPDSISYLRRHGLPGIRAAKKGPNSVEDGIAFLRRFRQIVIHTRCVHTRTEAKLYSYKVDIRSGDVIAQVVDKHNHLMDALRYALEPIMKKAREARNIFTDDVGFELCGACENRLPDTGICVHCGWERSIDEPSGVIQLGGSPRPLVIDAIEQDTIQERVHALTTNGNGNGNGHANGNGTGNGHRPKRNLTRGLND